MSVPEEIIAAWREGEVHALDFDALYNGETETVPQIQLQSTGVQFESAGEPTVDYDYI